jgi:general stress protein YciG
MFTMARNKGNNNMGMEERGRKGGEVTSRTHDKDFYQEIGRKGGNARQDNDNK